MKLETDRLILRNWILEDKEALIDNLNDIEVTKWMAFYNYLYV